MTSMSMVSFCLVMHSMHAVYLRVIHEMDSMHACYLSNRPIHEVDSIQSCHDAIHVMVVRGGYRLAGIYVMVRCMLSIS